MKNFYILIILLILSAGFSSCEKDDASLINIDEQGRIAPEGVEGFIGPESINPNVNDGTHKSKAGAGRLDEPVASGDGWVLVKVAHEETGEDYIHDEAEWVLKGVAKRTVANYWVKEKLLGDNLAKFLTKKPGPLGFLIHFLTSIPHAGGSDEFPQTYVKESDGGTYEKSENNTLVINTNFGWFETVTNIERDDSEQFDYYMGLYFWDNSQRSYTTLATAYLPFNVIDVTGSACMMVWDFDLKLYNYADAYEVHIWRRNNSNWEEVVCNRIKYL